MRANKRAEGLQLFQSLVSQNTDIQTVFAFGGAFESLLRIIAQEGGVEGGVAAYGCLVAIDGLLKYNSSTQVCTLPLFCTKLTLSDLLSSTSSIHTAIPVIPSYNSTGSGNTARVCTAVLGRAQGAKCRVGRQYHRHNGKTGIFFYRLSKTWISRKRQSIYGCSPS